MSNGHERHSDREALNERLLETSRSIGRAVKQARQAGIQLDNDFIFLTAMERFDQAFTESRDSGGLVMKASPDSSISWVSAIVAANEFFEERLPEETG
jgi:hypothetical protein